jgi:capsular polysaccharide biosynthesis protein
MDYLSFGITSPRFTCPYGAVLQNMIFYYTKLRTERILENKKKLVGFARFWRVLYLTDYQVVDKYLHFFDPKNNEKCTEK